MRNAYLNVKSHPMYLTLIFVKILNFFYVLHHTEGIGSCLVQYYRGKNTGYNKNVNVRVYNKRYVRQFSYNLFWNMFQEHILNSEHIQKEHIKSHRIWTTNIGHINIHTPIHTYIHTYIHPYIHPSIHPYIHTYIHTN